MYVPVCLRVNAPDRRIRLLGGLQRTRGSVLAPPASRVRPTGALVTEEAGAASLIASGLCWRERQIGESTLRQAMGTVKQIDHQC